MQICILINWKPAGGVLSLTWSSGSETFFGWNTEYFGYCLYMLELPSLKVFWFLPLVFFHLLHSMWVLVKINLSLADYLNVCKYTESLLKNVIKLSMP